jgi:hypothetical protein
MKVINKKKLALFFEILEILESIPAVVRVENCYNKAEVSNRILDVTITINQNSSPSNKKELNK